MKKYIKSVCLICSLVMLFYLNTSALDKQSYSWYCKRNTTHEQPQIDAEMQFIEDLGGFYVDKSSKNEKTVYLTFDAGYENGNVEKILDILKAEKINGSFFVLENLLLKEPELIKRMVNEGNLVCNHTATHKDISKLSFNELKSELTRVESLFNEITERELPKYFRPPEGRFSRESLQNLQKLGYKTVLWSFAYADWDNNSQMSYEKAIKKVMDNIHNGEIMLLHPTSSTNVKILPEVIQKLKSEGYTFKTVDKL